MQQPCPNAFQMGSALLSVLGPAASRGWSLQPALGMRCSCPRGPGLGICWGDRHQPNASGQRRALGGTLGWGRGSAVGTNGSDPSLGAHGGRRDAPPGISQGTTRPPPRALPVRSAPLGMLPPSQSRGCSAGHPAEGTRSRRCPGPAPAPADSKSRLAGGPGARRARPAGFARRQAAHDPRRGAKG